MTTEARELTPRRDRRPVRWLDVKRGSVRVSTATKEGARAVRDVRHLLRFRLSGLRGKARRAAPIGLTVLVAVTLLASFVPAFVPEYRIARTDVLILLPTAYISVLVISITSAAANGGGRELLPREQAVAFPVSATADHLGALLMAPLNIAWLLQGWSILGMTAYAVGPRPLLPLALLPVYLWLFTGTALAQTIAWVVEYVRRGRRGSNVVRLAAVLVGGTIAVLIATHRMTAVLDDSPTLRVLLAVIAGANGEWLAWAELLVWLGAIAIVAVVVGAFMADKVSRRPARDELKVETVPARGARAPCVGLRGPPAHRPGRHLAVRADAPGHGRARGLPRPHLARGRLRVGPAGDLPRAGGLRWRAAVRRELLVPRRPRRALARQPAGLGRGWRSAPGSPC